MIFRSICLLRSIPLLSLSKVSVLVIAWNALLLVLLHPLGCLADEATALKLLQSLGGREISDVRRPDRPIVKLFLSGPRVTDEAMESVVVLQKLELLDLSRSKVTDAGLKKLSALTNLKELSLEGCAITDVGLSELVSLTSLESLNIRRTTMTETGLSHLVSLPRLRALKVSARDYSQIQVLNQFKNLEQLSIDGVCHSLSIPIELSELKTLPNLKSLVLLCWPESVLRGLSELASLESLDLSGAWLSSNSDHLLSDVAIAELKPLKKLRTLTLEGRKIDRAGFQAIGQLTELRYLNLSWTNATDDIIAHLQDLKSLKTLNLDKTDVTDTGLRKLRNALPNTKVVFQAPTRAVESSDVRSEVAKIGGFLIEAVEMNSGNRTINSWNLRGNKKVSDDNLKIVNELHGLSSLDLSRTSVTDVGLKHLKGHKSLYKLNLDGTTITDAGVENLKDLVRLKDLSLSDTLLTDKGLAELSMLKRLKILKLNKTMITEVGLLELNKLSGLETLEIRGLTIGEVGLNNLIKLNSLKTLVINKSDVASEDFFAKITSALPKVDIKTMDSAFDSQSFPGSMP